MDAKKTILISLLILFTAGLCSALVADVPPDMGLPIINWQLIGHADDPDIFHTVHWQGTFTLENDDQIVLLLQADEDTRVFIDGVLAAENHCGRTSNISTDLSAGTHVMDVFYGDHLTVFDQIVFKCSELLSPVSEPAAICLLGFGVLNLVSRRKRAYIRIKAERDKKCMPLP